MVSGFRSAFGHTALMNSGLMRCAKQHLSLSVGGAVNITVILPAMDSLPRTTLRTAVSMGDSSGVVKAVRCQTPNPGALCQVKPLAPTRLASSSAWSNVSNLPRYFCPSFPLLLGKSSGFDDSASPLKAFWPAMIHANPPGSMRKGAKLPSLGSLKTTVVSAEGGVMVWSRACSAPIMLLVGMMVAMPSGLTCTP